MDTSGIIRSLKNEASRTKPIIENGRRVLKYGSFLRIVSTVMFSGMSFLLISMISNGQSFGYMKIMDLVLFYITLLCLWGLGAYAFLESWFVKITFTDKEIHHSTPWRRGRIVLWEDVIDYSYSGYSGYHKLYTLNQGVIRLSSMLLGISSIIKRARNKRKSHGSSA